MIFYFSATGNSKYAALKISEAANERLISITESLKNNQYRYSLTENEILGFVTPTYFWGLPTVVLDFLSRLEIKATAKNYVFHVLTLGMYTGAANEMLAKQLALKGLHLNAKFSVKMVDTWTPIFDLTDPEKNVKVTAEAEPQIADVIQKIIAHTPGDFNRYKGFGAGLISPFAYSTYKKGRETSKFTVSDACIDCGLCAKICPVGAIEIKDKKPVWIKDQCALCLGCLHRCPKFAITYGPKTAKHGQFVNPNVKL
jgi:ferredoxin